MLVDSHCHVNFPELYDNLDDYINQMKANNIDYGLCVATRPDNQSKVIEISDKYQQFFSSVGIHPDERLEDFVLSHDYLLNLAKSSSKVVAIGETGLDYYRVNDEDMTWQHERFVTHIDVAKQLDLPLIIHTRESIADTLSIMKDNNASEAGAVMHCFTENLEHTKKCLDMGFYISLSGIVTFKNAHIVQEVAKYMPLDRLLVETDAPFLAPVPYRGKTNHPALVKYTAQYIADLKGISLEALAVATTNNFFDLFKKAKRNI